MSHRSMMTAQAPPGHQSPSQRKRSSVYVDDDFGADNEVPGQESLSAFGLKLIDSRKSIAELYGITTSPNTTPASFSHFSQNSNPDRTHRKKRKKSQLTLADLNSVVDVDALLKNNEASSVGNGAKDGKVNLHEKEPNSFAQASSDMAAQSDSDTVFRPAQVIKLPIPDHPESDSHPTEISVNAQTKDAFKQRPVLTSTNHLLAAKSRSSKRGFFGAQLPSRIPRRPQPEKFDTSKKPPPPRSSALRQLNALSSKVQSSFVEDVDVNAKQASPDAEKSDSNDFVSCEDALQAALPGKRPTKPAAFNSRVFQRIGHFERNTDPALPRNPDAAVKLLPNLPSERRSAFLEHIFYFFNHIHLATLIKLHNSNFIKYLEKWILDGIKSKDKVFLRTSLLLLEVLPVTPSTHCRALQKILKASHSGDTIIANLLARVSDKWQLLEQTIRSHKASREKEIECKRSISFCDETETLEYSIYLPPDTVRKTKKSAMKGVLKQTLRIAAVKDAPLRGSSSTPFGAAESIPKDPRLQLCSQPVSGIVSSASNGIESISSSDLTALRQSLDAEVPTKMSNVPFGTDGQVFGSQDDSAGSAGSGPAADSQVSYDSDFQVGSIHDFEDEQPASERPVEQISSDSQNSTEVSPAHADASSGLKSRIGSVVEKPADSHAPFGVALFNANSGSQRSFENCMNPLSQALKTTALKGNSIEHRPVSRQGISAPIISARSSDPVLRNVPDQVAFFSETDGDSADALLSLVPSIVKDFSTSLLIPKSHPVSSISPNPFLSSSQIVQGQAASNRSFIPSERAMGENLIRTR